MHIHMYVYVILVHLALPRSPYTHTYKNIYVRIHIVFSYIYTNIPSNGVRATQLAQREWV